MVVYRAGRSRYSRSPNEGGVRSISNNQVSPVGGSRNNSPSPAPVQEGRVFRQTPEGNIVYQGTPEYEADLLRSAQAEARSNPNSEAARLQSQGQLGQAVSELAGESGNVTPNRSVVNESSPVSVQRAEAERAQAQQAVVDHAFQNQGQGYTPAQQAQIAAAAKQLKSQGSSQIPQNIPRSIPSVKEAQVSNSRFAKIGVKLREFDGNINDFTGMIFGRSAKAKNAVSAMRQPFEILNAATPFGQAPLIFRGLENLRQRYVENPEQAAQEINRKVQNINQENDLINSELAPYQDNLRLQAARSYQLQNDINRLNSQRENLDVTDPVAVERFNAKVNELNQRADEVRRGDEELAYYLEPLQKRQEQLAQQQAQLEQQKAEYDQSQRLTAKNVVGSTVAGIYEDYVRAPVRGVSKLVYLPNYFPGSNPLIPIKELETNVATDPEVRQAAIAGGGVALGLLTGGGSLFTTLSSEFALNLAAAQTAETVANPTVTNVRHFGSALAPIVLEGSSVSLGSRKVKVVEPNEPVIFPKVEEVVRKGKDFDRTTYAPVKSETFIGGNENFPLIRERVIPNTLNGGFDIFVETRPNVVGKAQAKIAGRVVDVDVIGAKAPKEKINFNGKPVTIIKQTIPEITPLNSQEFLRITKGSAEEGFTQTTVRKPKETPFETELNLPFTKKRQYYEKFSEKPRIVIEGSFREADPSLNVFRKFEDAGSILKEKTLQGNTRIRIRERPVDFEFFDAGNKFRKEGKFKSSPLPEGFSKDVNIVGPLEFENRIGIQRASRKAVKISDGKIFDIEVVSELVDPSRLLEPPRSVKARKAELKPFFTGEISEMPTISPNTTPRVESKSLPVISLEDFNAKPKLNKKDNLPVRPTSGAQARAVTIFDDLRPAREFTLDTEDAGLLPRSFLGEEKGTVKVRILEEESNVGPLSFGSSKQERTSRGEFKLLPVFANFTPAPTSPINVGKSETIRTRPSNRVDPVSLLNLEVDTSIKNIFKPKQGGGQKVDTSSITMVDTGFVQNILPVQEIIPIQKIGQVYDFDFPERTPPNPRYSDFPIFYQFDDDNDDGGGRRRRYRRRRKGYRNFGYAPTLEGLFSGRTRPSRPPRGTAFSGFEIRYPVGPNIPRRQPIRRKKRKERPLSLPSFNLPRISLNARAPLKKKRKSGGRRKR